MTGRSIAVANMKGGVGKTTTVVMLAEGFAAAGASVLVVDLDPQASASVSLAGEDLLTDLIRRGRTLDAFLALRVIRREQTELRSRIRDGISLSTHAGQPLTFSLLPSGPFLRLVEREIVHELTLLNYTMSAIEGQLWRLFRDELTPMTEHFDYVIFDCAPGISPMTDVAVRSADLVLVTSIPDFLSTFGLAAFFQTFWGRVTHSTLPTPRGAPHVLATRVQRATKQHRATLERLAAEAEATGSFRLLATTVPQSASLAAALMPREPMPTFTLKYGAMLPTVIQPLLAEIQEILHGG